MSSIRCRGALGAAALLLAGCSHVTPPTPPSSGVTHASEPASASPGPSSPSPSLALPLDALRVPTNFTPADLTTDGTWISWSGGAGSSAADIFRWRPGQAEPEVVWRDADRSAAIDHLVTNGSAYAFIEAGPPKNDTITWSLWYVAHPGDAGRKLETVTRPVDKLGVVALPAISDRYLVYTMQRVAGDELTSEVVAVDLATSASRVLVSSDFREVEYWYPSLDGSRLTYSAAEYANNPLHAERHVYLQDLDSGEAARRLDPAGEASQPVILGQTVIWKTAPFQRNVNNWGQLVEYSLKDGSTREIDLGPASGYVMPQLGPRFVTAEPNEWTTLTAFDLEANRSVVIATVDPKGDAGFMRPTLAGNLMAYVAAPDFTGVGSEIRYVELPPPS